MKISSPVTPWFYVARVPWGHSLTLLIYIYISKYELEEYLFDDIPQEISMEPGLYSLKGLVEKVFVL